MKIKRTMKTALVSINPIFYFYSFEMFESKIFVFDGFSFNDYSFIINHVFFVCLMVLQVNKPIVEEVVNVPIVETGIGVIKEVVCYFEESDMVL